MKNNQTVHIFYTKNSILQCYDQVKSDFISKGVPFSVYVEGDFIGGYRLHKNKIEFGCVNFENEGGSRRIVLVLCKDSKIEHYYSLRLTCIAVFSENQVFIEECEHF